MSKPLVKFEDLKALLDLEKDSLTDYPALAVIMDSVQSGLESYTGRILAGEDKVTQTGIEMFSTRYLYLKALPIKSVTSVTVGGVATTDYTVTSYGLKLGRTAADDSDWSVEYVGGFDEIPGELIRAALIQTGYEYQTKEHIGAEQVSTDGGSVQTPALALLSEVKKRLDPFVHIARML